MTAEEVARFLQTHPQFFDQHPELLESVFRRLRQGAHEREMSKIELED